jgi:hypothetical protein
MAAHPRPPPARRTFDPALRGWIQIVLGTGDALIGRLHLHEDAATATDPEDAADAEGMIREELRRKVIPLVALFPVYALSRSVVHQIADGQVTATAVHAADRMEHAFDVGRNPGVPYRVALTSFQFCSEFDAAVRRRLAERLQLAENAHRARLDGLTALQ